MFVSTLLIISIHSYNFIFRQPDDSIQLKDFNKVLKSQASSLTHLNIFLPKSDTFFSLKDFLVNCHKLKYLSIAKEQENPMGKKFFLNPLPKLNLEVLRIFCHFCSVIHMLMDCEVHKLYVNRKNIWKCCESSFQRFKEKQENLKIGILNEFCSYEGEINVISSARVYDEIGSVFYYR